MYPMWRYVSVRAGATWSRHDSYSYSQATSFEVSMSAIDVPSFARSVHVNRNDSVASTSSSCLWELRLELAGFQSTTDVVVWLPEHASGIVPQVAASNRAKHTFRPLTSAGPGSLLACNTSTEVNGGVQRGVPVRCVLSMVDTFGDRVKGDVGTFSIHADHGNVSTLTPVERGWEAEFMYSPPDHALEDVVRVRVVDSQEYVRGGVATFVISDEVSSLSELVCKSPDNSSEVIHVSAGGATLACTISARDGIGDLIRGLPSDFRVGVLGQFEILGNRDTSRNVSLSHSDLRVVAGGHRFVFDVRVPAHMEGDPHLLTHSVSVVVQLANGVHVATHVVHTAHTPDILLSKLVCFPVEPDPTSDARASSLDSDEVWVGVNTHETIVCDIYGMKHVVDALTVPVKALAKEFTVRAKSGLVSQAVPVNGGISLRFW